MLKKRNVWVVLACLLLVSVAIPFVFAAEGDQTPPPPPGQGQGGPGGPGGGQRGQGQGRGGDFQAQMIERAKTELAASNETWTKIEPLLSKVVTLNNEINARGMRGGRQGQGRPDQPQTAPQAAQSDVQKATVALRALTQDDTSSMDEVKAKLADLRKAKEKAKEELAKAQEELKKAVDARQEAKLVLMGLLN
jgi:hypothetical protein